MRSGPGDKRENETPSEEVEENALLRCFRPLTDWIEALLNPLSASAIVRPPSETLGFYRHFLDPVKGLLAVVLIISFLGAVAEMSLFYFLGLLVDWMQTGSPETFLKEYGLFLTLMAVFIVVVRPVLTVTARAFINLSLSPGLTNLVRWRTHRYVLRQSLSYFQNDFAGRIAQKIQQTGNALRETVINIVDGVWFLVIYLVGTLWLFAGIDWQLMVPVVAWTVGYGCVIAFLVPPVRKRSAALSHANSTLSGRIVDSYTNIQTVKLFAHADREDAFVGEALKGHQQAFQNMMRWVLLMTGTMMILNSVLIFVNGALTVYLWMDGSITLGAVALANGLIIRLNQMSGWILRTITSLFESIGVVQDGIQTISQPNSVTDTEDAIEFRVSRGEVKFESVRFHYGKETGVIDDLSLTIGAGERVGLVGPSGAGKSTFVNLLLRLYDVEAGRILIDGQDISRVRQESLRAEIGMVTQDTSLLHRSIRENLLYGRPDAGEAAMIMAATRARAMDFIPDLVDAKGRAGFDAHVGERGVKLSGGQRQRIAIARVLLKDAPILVLDEATSALDSEIEAAIQDQLEHLMEGKTVIAVAHRLSTIARMDRLIVLDRGGIVETGSHAELVESGGLYSELWKRQSGGFIAA